MRKLKTIGKVILAVIAGWVLTVLMMRVPVGYSDAEVETIGRIYYCGLPIPHAVCTGWTIVYGFFNALRTLPFNLLFWTTALLFLLCLKHRHRFLTLLLCALLAQCAIMALLFFHVFF